MIDLVFVDSSETTQITIAETVKCVGECAATSFELRVLSDASYQNRVKSNADMTEEFVHGGDETRK